MVLISPPMVAAALSVVGALLCLGLLLDWPTLRSHLVQWFGSWMGVERVREDLAQAGLAAVPPATWIGLRVGGSAAVGGMAYLLFGVLVLAMVGVLVTYHLAGIALEHKRRERQLERQHALLEAVRYGAAVMSRGGNASDMLSSLALSGPRLTRPIFAQLVPRPGDDISLPVRVAELREQMAEPLFDDVALSLILHWKRGARLVPALEAIVGDWEESVRLQRDARVMRAGVEATVIVLTILPVFFLGTLQILSPELLQPFHSAAGQALLGGAVLWMVLGYRLLQRMAEPPREERLRLRQEGA